MKFIIRLHAEITIKSNGVRKRYGKLLVNNLKSILQRRELKGKVAWCWDRIELEVSPVSQSRVDEIIELLQRVPGIAWFSQSYEMPLPEGDPTDFGPITELVSACWQPVVTGKSFVVRVKRKGDHPFRSLDLERYLGGALLRHCADSRVSLKHPEVEVRLEIDHHTVRVFGDKIQGLGGFPLPSQETVLSLLSGGFDSSVASFQLIRRGARVHFCFFNLGGAQHETGVRQTAYYLWQQYASSHPLKFISVDFAPIVEEILTKVDNGLMGVVLKRQMLRAAELVADKLNTAAIVTGEALGQVSSQTLSNLQVIDEVTSKLVLRPLITMDKQDIVNIARDIGVEEMAASIPEYCGVISKKPTVKAKHQVVLSAEAGITDEMIEQEVMAAPVKDIREVHEQPTSYMPPIFNYESDLPEGTVVIDIRSPEEEEEAPLVLTSTEMVHIPFFKLANKMQTMDANKRYALYCQQGVMSRLQAIALKEQGVAHLALFEPKD